MKKAICVPPLTEEQRADLDQLYRKTEIPRLRTRAQMVLLSAEKRLKADEIAEVVRESAVTVLRWLHRYISEGIEGLKDAPRAGRSSFVTGPFRKRLLEVVRRRPRSMGLAYSMWTLQRLADFLAEEKAFACRMKPSDESWRKKELCSVAHSTRFPVQIQNTRSKKDD